MTTEHAELFSALMDREAVDPDALAQALDDPEARRALVAFAALRQELHAPAPGEAEWLATQRQPVARSSATPPNATRQRDRWRLVAAAVLLAAGLGAGVVAERYRSEQRPPTPTRVVQLDPLPGKP